MTSPCPNCDTPTHADDCKYWTGLDGHGRDLPCTCGLERERFHKRYHEEKMAELRTQLADLRQKIGESEKLIKEWHDTKRSGSSALFAIERLLNGEAH